MQSQFKDFSIELKYGNWSEVSFQSRSFWSALFSNEWLTHLFSCWFHRSPLSEPNDSPDLVFCPLYQAFQPRWIVWPCSNHGPPLSWWRDFSLCWIVALKESLQEPCAVFFFLVPPRYQRYHTVKLPSTFLPFCSMLSRYHLLGWSLHWKFGLFASNSH